MNSLVESGKDFLFEISNHDNSYPTWHQELEIAFVLKSTGVLRLGDRLVSYSLHEGDIFVIGSYEMHEVSMDSGGMVVSLYLSPGFLTLFSPETADVMFECKSFLFPPEDQAPFDVIRTDFARAFQALNKNEAHSSSLHLRSKIVILLDDLICYFSNSATEKRPTFHKGREHLRTATNYIDHHYDESITLNDLAEQIYLSESYLSRLFTKTMGLTFTAYLTQVRLNHATSLLRSNLTITEIAFKSGFTSTNSFIKTFKQAFKKTPGQYKKELGEQLKQSLYTESAYFPDDFGVLLQYMQKQTQTQTKSQAEIEINEEREVRVDITKPLRTLSHNWKRLINVGYAKDLLNFSVQKQIAQMQREIGFQFARVKGILDDDMVFYNLGSDGSPVYNFTYIDEVIDFLLSAGFIPFVELSYMPSLLAKEQFTIFKRKSIISLPNDMNKWKDMLSTLVAHLIQRYGAEHVGQWLFTVCFNPFFHNINEYRVDEYWLLYRESFRTVRKLLPHCRICGPGNVMENQLPELLDRCVSENCVPDILAFHTFHSVSPESEETDIKLLNSDEAFPLSVSADESYLQHLYNRIKKLLSDRGFDNLPIMLDEWNNSLWQRDLCNDTSYKSTFLFKNILENYDRYYSMGYWTISDFIEELSPSPHLFHGGFGLFTRNGLAKSAYRALQLLNHVGEKLIAAQDGCFISSSKGTIQIFLYNYSHYDLLYRFRHTANMTATQRYNVFQKRNPQLFYINLLGLQPGNYTMRRYSIGPDGGSVYDAWVKMGAPQEITEEVKKILDGQSYPLMHVQSLRVEKELTLKTILPPHEVQLITLSEH